MKKLMVLVLVILPLLSGCWIYGKGSTVGYITTVEDACVVFGYSRVWFRVETGTFSSAQSQPEAYAILKSNTTLIKQLIETAKKHQKIELIYDKHIKTAAVSDDVVVGFNIVD